MAIIAPKGTKDTLPAQVYKWHYVEQKFSEICEKYGFREIRTPMFEHTELFKRGVGDTTDIVQKEMYTFEDYAGRSITLKPEGTSPVTRAFIEHKQYAEVQPTQVQLYHPLLPLRKTAVRQIESLPPVRHRDLRYAEPCWQTLRSSASATTSCTRWASTTFSCASTA